MGTTTKDLSFLTALHSGETGQTGQTCGKIGAIGRTGGIGDPAVAHVNSATSRRRVTRLLVIQPTPFCNLDCSYCYLPHRSNRDRMSAETLERIGELILGGDLLTKEATVIWHAGEPLTLPPSWYEDAFAILERHRLADVRISHAFQTNATLLDERWLPIVSRHDVRIGISIDGPESIHDTRRRTRGGRGTFSRTIRGLRFLRDSGVPFHVITVLSWETLSQPDELFDFYISEGIERISFNIEEIEGINKGSSLKRPDVKEAFRAFLRRFIERNSMREHPLWIREFADSIRTISIPSGAALPNLLIEPLAIVSVSSSGNMSTFSPELLGNQASKFMNFEFGNIHHVSPDQMLLDASFQNVLKEIEQGVAVCRKSCPWFRWCGEIGRAHV